MDVIRSLKSRLAVGGLCAAILIGTFGAAGADAKFRDRDCGDFNSQAQAQKFFKSHNPQRDRHRLDADNDGKACESYDY